MKRYEEVLLSFVKDFKTWDFAEQDGVTRYSKGLTKKQMDWLKSLYCPFMTKGYHNSTKSFEAVIDGLSVDVFLFCNGSGFVKVYEIKAIDEKKEREGQLKEESNQHLFQCWLQEKDPERSRIMQTAIISLLGEEWFEKQLEAVW